MERGWESGIIYFPNRDSFMLIIAIPPLAGHTNTKKDISHPRN
jgi:hypothetical protein